jgi:hypothetical protein
MGIMRRALDRFAASTDDLEAEELRGAAAAHACAPIAQGNDRDVVTVHGTLKAVTLRPRGGVAALEAELYDGSGSVTLVWLGRRRIAGVDPGQQMTVHGRLSLIEDVRVLYNPPYELTQ